MKNKVKFTLTVAVLFFATSCREKKLLLTIKNSSYSIDSLNMEVIINDSIYFNTIIDNDSIDHSFQTFVLDVPNGENEIAIFSSNAEGEKKIVQKFKFPDQYHLSIVYYYHKILLGTDTIVSVPPRWDLKWR